jgi:hypothetical protein
MENKEFFIPYNCPSSKNSKIFTGTFLIWSKTAQEYRRKTLEYWLLSKIEFRKEVIKAVSLNGWPIKVSFKYIRGSKHKFDYCNPLQTTLDLMVENGWISDDNADIILPSFEPYEYSKDNPGTIIKIL